MEASALGSRRIGEASGMMLGGGKIGDIDGCRAELLNGEGGSSRADEGREGRSPPSESSSSLVPFPSSPFTSSNLPLPTKKRPTHHAQSTSHQSYSIPKQQRKDQPSRFDPISTFPSFLLLTSIDHDIKVGLIDRSSFDVRADELGIELTRVGARHVCGKRVGVGGEEGGRREEEGSG